MTFQRSSRGGDESRAALSQSHEILATQRTSRSRQSIIWRRGPSHSGGMRVRKAP